MPALGTRAGTWTFTHLAGPGSSQTVAPAWPGGQRPLLMRWKLPAKESVTRGLSSRGERPAMTGRTEPQCWVLKRKQPDLHRALGGAGGGGGGCRPLGVQGLAPELIGTVLGSWAGLLDGHLCCGCCRRLFIWEQNTAGAELSVHVHRYRYRYRRQKGPGWRADKGPRAEQLFVRPPEPSGAGRQRSTDPARPDPTA